MHAQPMSKVVPKFQVQPWKTKTPIISPAIAQAWLKPSKLISPALASSQIDQICGSSGETMYG